MIHSLSRLPMQRLSSDHSSYDFDAEDPRDLKHLSLDQQKKRAKELLKQWHANHPDSIARTKSLSARSTGNVIALKLSDAQHVIAREQGFKNWSEFKTYIENTRLALQSVQAGNPTALDADRPTLHIRCGTDIQHALSVAGFIGDFMPFYDPFIHGPVPRTQTLEEFIHIRAKFTEEAYQASGVVELLTKDYQDLAKAKDYPRVALWLEHDSYDQLILARLLQYFSDPAHRPEDLEFISVTHFPGVKKFNGIGQLPPEAMRVLWGQFTEVTDAQLTLGKQVWEALTASSPEKLHALAFGDMHDLPVMQAALRRHLRELPSIKNGLGLSEQLTLQILADKGSMNAGRLFGWYTNHYEPLPFMGDTGYWYTIHFLAEAGRPAITIDKHSDKPVDWQVAMTPIGEALLLNQTDWITLNGISRWLGGVALDSERMSVWRYDDIDDVLVPGVNPA